jgi:hypothetical protein
MSRRLPISNLNSNSKRTDQKSAQIRGSTSSFSVIPLLLAGQSISPEARQALRENRLKDATVIFMEEYGLSCDEAGNLLNITAC